MRDRSAASRLSSLLSSLLLGSLAVMLLAPEERVAGGEGPPSPPNGQGVVKGIVVDEAGKPVPGACVRAIAYPGG